MYVYLKIHVCIRTSFPSDNNGDIHLSGNPHNDTKEGILTIYLNNETGTICKEGFNEYAAHAACREMGYIKALKWGTASDMKYVV